MGLQIWTTMPDPPACFNWLFLLYPLPFLIHIFYMEKHAQQWTGRNNACAESATCLEVLEIPTAAGLLDAVLKTNQENTFESLLHFQEKIMERNPRQHFIWDKTFPCIVLGSGKADYKYQNPILWCSCETRFLVTTETQTQLPFLRKRRIGLFTEHLLFAKQEASYLLCPMSPWRNAQTHPSIQERMLRVA
jgi:hypothetical protein